MLSSNIVPPRSFAPARRPSCAILIPSLTHETWMFTKLSRKSRATATIRPSSLPCCPGAGKAGLVDRRSSYGQTRAGQTPVKPVRLSPGSRGGSRRCRARSASLSQWPYMIVAVVGMPRAWASFDDPDPLRGRDLLRADLLPDGIDEDLSRRPAHRGKAGRFHRHEHVLCRHAALFCRVCNLHRVARMEVDTRRRLAESSGYTSM